MSVRVDNWYTHCQYNYVQINSLKNKTKKVRWPVACMFCKNENYSFVVSIRWSHDTQATLQKCNYNSLWAPLTLINSNVKINTSPPLMNWPRSLSPYPSSEGMYNSHLSPSFINCMASVHPLMTWLGANVLGLPRLMDESNSVPSMRLPA